MPASAALPRQGCFDPAPWNVPGLKLGSVEQETTDEAIEVHQGGGR
jgi:hypothetical protein